MRLSDKARTAALGGVLLALACGLSALESAVALPLPAGIKPGLANVIIMFALFHINVKTALTVNILKSCFVLLTRGVTAFGMSLCGGMLSLLVIIILCKTAKPSLLLMSVCGAVSHNIGQLSLAALLLGSSSVFGYLPVLLAAGIPTGILTGLVLRAAERPLSRLTNGKSVPHNSGKD